jgi:hypothetical protein
MRLKNPINHALNMEIQLSNAKDGNTIIEYSSQLRVYDNEENQNVVIRGALSEAFFRV